MLQSTALKNWSRPGRAWDLQRCHGNTAKIRRVGLQAKLTGILLHGGNDGFDKGR